MRALISSGPGGNGYATGRWTGPPGQRRDSRAGRLRSPVSSEFHADGAAGAHEFMLPAIGVLREKVTGPAMTFVIADCPHRHLPVARRARETFGQREGGQS
ncbi:hypothetical protein DMB42_28610 [Nonomuraea sp. WAC 01424]|nr:hypothetical protein DMB42_28610 [Nonomuraea sp. WAC 01424]